MKTTVTNLIQHIGKCRDILATKDVNEVSKHLYLFEKVHTDVKIQLDRFIKKPTYQLDFTIEDIQELSDEIFEFIKNHQTKFTYSALLKDLTKNKTIDNTTLYEFTQNKANWMYVDRKLREAYKILSYLAITLWVLTEAEKQNDLDVQITEIIRSFL